MFEVHRHGLAAPAQDMFLQMPEFGHQGHRRETPALQPLHEHLGGVWGNANDGHIVGRDAELAEPGADHGEKSLRLRPEDYEMLAGNIGIWVMYIPRAIQKAREYTHGVVLNSEGSNRLHGCLQLSRHTAQTVPNLSKAVLTRVMDEVGEELQAKLAQAGDPVTADISVVWGQKALQGSRSVKSGTFLRMAIGETNVERVIAIQNRDALVVCCLACAEKLPTQTFLLPEFVPINCRSIILERKVTRFAWCHVSNDARVPKHLFVDHDAYLSWKLKELKRPVHVRLHLGR